VELQIPVFGDQESFNVVRKVTALEVHGWGSIPGWDYHVGYQISTGNGLHPVGPWDFPARGNVTGL